MDNFDISVSNFDKKLLINYFWVLTKDLEYSGVLSFSVTLNFLEKYKEEDSFKLNDTINLFVENLKNSIELLSYIVIIAELNKNKCWHLHITIGIKSIIGFNPVIKENLYRKLLWLGYSDVNVKNLNKDKDVYNWFVYSFKDVKPDKINWRFWALTAIDIEPLFRQIFKNLNELIKITHPLKLINWAPLPNSPYDFMLGSKNIGEDAENACLNLWYYYMYLNDIRVHKKRLYKRIKNTYISYELFGEMDVLDDKFTDIMASFLEKFPLQFENSDITNLKRKGLVRLETRIAIDVVRFDLNIKLRYDLLEFRDGIYSIKLNKFLRSDRVERDSLESQLKGLATIKYYDRHYKNLNFNTAWKQKLFETVQGNNEDIRDIAVRIANIFHRSEELVGKQKALYIWGESNTGKTSLIANPIITFFGKENIGYFTASQQFKFEGLLDKEVAIVDEFVIGKNNRALLQEIKKLLSEEDLMINRKHKQAALADKIPIIIISNYNLDHLEFTENEALRNRMKQIKFSRKVKNKKASIKRLLDNEEAAMIIQCNRIYWDEFEKKTRKTPRQLVEIFGLGDTLDKLMLNPSEHSAHKKVPRKTKWDRLETGSEDEETQPQTKKPQNRLE